MIFNDVELLGYNHQNTFFGEKSFQYSSKKIFSIRGYALDLTNSNGSQGVFDKINELLESTKIFQNVTINGENFGRGKVTSFSVDNGNWVKYAQYQATIEVYEECSLENLASVNLNGTNFYLLKSFSENFNINYDTQNKTVDGDHTIDIQYDAVNSSTPLITYAQVLAKELLKTLPTSVKEVNYSTRNNFKVLNSENYSLIDGRCGFKKSFSYNNEDVSKNYSIQRTHSLTLNEEGVATVTEDCEIKGEYDVPSLYGNAKIGLDSEITEVKSRCDNFFNTYKTKFDINKNLNQTQIEKTVRINKFDGVINYTISFDNDKKKENNTYIFESTQTLEKDENGIWSASETGDIDGLGNIDKDFNKYKSAEQGWNAQKGGVQSRIESFYNVYAKNKPVGATLKLLSYSINRSKYQGKISYDYRYTDDPELQTNNQSGITKIIVERSDTGLRPISKPFIAPGGGGYPVLQNRDLKQQGTYTVNVEFIVGCSLETTFNSRGFFSEARNLATNLSNGNDKYLESIDYNTDEIEKTIKLTATYLYS